MQGYRPIVLYQATLLCKQACSFFFYAMRIQIFLLFSFSFFLFSLENLHAGLSPYSFVSSNASLQASLLILLLRHAHSDFPPLFFLFFFFSLENLHAGLSPYSFVSSNASLQASLLKALLDTKLHGYFIAKRSQVQFLH